MLPKPSECVGCPLHSAPYGKPVGFSLPDGAMTGGVAIVAEALGEAEEQAGRPLVGKSGHALFQQLKRVGIDREEFRILNCLFCRPPNNKLVKMPYEAEALAHCSPILDRELEAARDLAKENGKTFVIVALGLTPFKRLLGLDYRKDSELLKLDNYAYPFWSEKYGAWIFHCPHPAYLLRGKTNLWPILQFIFKRALEVANNGLVLDVPDYLLDPDPSLFDTWIKGFELSLESDPDNPLSYDIETPYKRKTKDEEELGKEADAEPESHTILRISFAYFANETTYTVSVKWSAEYMAGIEHLFGISRYVLGWNSTNYDYPRVSRYLAIAGLDLDGMIAWHILNTALPKSLGFVTPFYVQTTGMWKHLSESEPAFYNAKDADMALRNFIGIRKDLIKNRLWHVFERHVIEINKVLKYMTGIGVVLDQEARKAAEEQLTTLLVDIEAKMEEAVPQEARKLKVFKKTPKLVTCPACKESPIAGTIFIKQFIDDGMGTETKCDRCDGSGEIFPEGMIEVEGEEKVKQCPVCSSVRVAASHFKPIGKKRMKAGEIENPCSGSRPNTVLIPSKLWAKPLEFKVSKVGLTNYQKSLQHQAIMDRKKGTTTFNADAITMLVKKYPKDKLYPQILAHRKVGKLLGTYVGVTQPSGLIRGGMPIGRDGRIHTQYTHNPSTLRFSSEDPNLQNLPRPNPGDPSDLCNLIRNLIVASPGCKLYARDFSGIEAVLTGYFALDPKYIRIAKRDVHTYYTVYALYELEGGARIKASDLPDIDWPDERLFPYLEQLKGQFKRERNSLYKHLVHAANFMQGAKGAQAKIFSETGVEYPVKTVQKVMDVYYALFPKIRQWHKNVLDEAEKDGYLRNPFDYIHRFSKVYDYKYEFGEWGKKQGPDANRAIAFKPQSTAAGIIKEAMLRLYQNRFEGAGEYLRLQVHDELFFDVPEDKVKALDAVVKEEMERPIPQMRLPASWGMGEFLNILTEEKMGYQWGKMK